MKNPPDVSNEKVFHWKGLVVASISVGIFDGRHGQFHSNLIRIDNTRMKSTDFLRMFSLERENEAVSFEFLFIETAKNDN